MTPKFHLTAPYSEVSTAIYNLFLSVTPIYREHVQKSLNVNDAWFGFYSHFKKGTLHVHMNYSKISRQKYSTNMVTGRRVTSRENDLWGQFTKVILIFFNLLEKSLPFLACREMRLILKAASLK